MLSVIPSDDEELKLEATVIECKISSFSKASAHIAKAKIQVLHGLEQLQRVFDPKSDSIERRYWFSQLYRALVFAQVTFTDNSEEFGDLSSKLRAVLDGKFSIEWNGEVLGYWFDMQGSQEVLETTPENINVYNIPQLVIQGILSGQESSEFVTITERDIAPCDEGDCNESTSLEEAALRELEEMNSRSRKKFLEKKLPTNIEGSISDEVSQDSSVPENVELDVKRSDDKEVSDSAVDREDNPVFSRRFHTDIATLVFNKPFFELQNRIVKGGETLLLIRRFHTGSSFNDCGNEKRFVDIDTTTGLINNFHSQELLSK